MPKSAASPMPRARVAALAGIALLAVVAVASAAWFLGRTLDPSIGPRFVQHVSAKGELRMDFPEPMEKESVVAAMTLPSGLRADSRWDGETLVLTPAAPLEAGRTYEIVIGRDAKKRDGTLLGKELVFRFVVAGAPKVAALVPAQNAADVPLDAVVTIVFDRPMVALTQVQGAPAEDQMKDWKVSVSPSVKGEWRWLSTYAAQLRPEGGLVPGTVYTISVPAGIPSAAGDATESELSWKFETVRPKVRSTQPEEGYALAGPTTEIELRFNLEMNAESVGKHVRIIRTGEAVAAAEPQPQPQTSPKPAMSMTGAGVPKGDSIAVRAVRFGKTEIDGKQVQDKRAVVVVPEKPLQFGSQYAVHLTPGALASRGDLGTMEPHTTRFSTVGPLRVLDARFEYGGLIVRFSNPLPETVDLKKLVTIEPKPEGWDDMELTMNSWSDNTELSLYPELKPSTKYAITIAPGLADRYGQKLGQPFSYAFETPRLMPQVAITGSRGDFGIFEREKPPVYRLSAVNVKTIDMEFARLTLEEFLEARRLQTQSYGSVPDLKAKAEYKAWSTRLEKPKENDWTTIELDLEKRLGKKLGAGIYALLVRSPEHLDWNGQPVTLVQFFALTNTSLTLKHSGDKALVWATDLRTGAPVADAKISFRALGGATPVQGKTDAQGFFETAIDIKAFQNAPYEWQPEFWVTAEKSGDFAFVGSTWNGGFSPGDFGHWSDFRSPDAPVFRSMVFLTTDRPTYRPGDTVSFKGIARLKEWSGKMILPGASRSAQVTIQDSSGTEIYKKTLPFTEYGGFSDAFPVAGNAALGAYSVLVQVVPDVDTQGPQYLPGFSVLAYRKPEYRVELTPKAEDAFDGDTIEVGLEGSYYFGAPLTGAPVQWRAQMTDYYFNRYTDGWYSFSLEDAWCWWNCERQTGVLTEGRGSLDDAGRMAIRVPVDISDKELSQIATIEADVSDPNNQVVSNRVSVPVHKSAVYVGIRPEEYGVPAGGTATVALIAVNPAGKPVPNQKIGVALFSRTWNTTRKKGVDGEFYYENEPVDSLVGEFTATTAADGKARAEMELPKGGQFVAVAQAHDSQGRVGKSSTSLYAWSGVSVNWPRPNNDRVEVVADRPEYRVGQTAKLLVKSPFSGDNVKALVTVERENVLTRKVIDVDSNALPIEIPVTEDLIPNAYVSVVILKPREGETYDDQGRDTGVPAFRVGYAELKVERSRKSIDVSVRTDKDRYLPGEKVTATLKAVDADGKPVRGEFSLAVADMSVLALSAFEMPEVLDTFYAQRGLGVMTSQMLLYLVERFKPGSKGGGGGEIPDRARGNFRDTAYWNPSIVTNDKGEATVSFTLPDNLTTWQLLAIGGTKDNRFGAGKREILETKDVIVRPVRPRFAVRGDAMTVSALVHNFLPDEKSFSVSLSGSGFSIQGKAEEQVTVKPGQQAKVNFQVRVGSAGSAVFTFRAKTSGASDAVTERIPVSAFSTPQSVATFGRSDTVVNEKVLVPSEQDAPAGMLHVSMAATMATYLPKALEFVATFPYGCAEQTASSFVPHVVLKRLQGFEAFRFLPEKDLDAKVTSGLQTLYRFQRADGGFGFWEDSTRSDPYLSAYILYALQLAKSTGYSVDAGVINRAGGYLSGVLRSQGKNAHAVDLATRAYILYVLAEIGQADRNLLDNLEAQRDKLPVFSQVELAMALQKAGSERKAKALLSHVLDGAIVDPRGAHVEEPEEERYTGLLQNTQRTTAETVQAMIRIDPDNALLPQFIRYLLTVRKDGHWDTTQSTVQSLLALVEYLKSENELDADFLAGVEVNGSMLLTKRFAGKTILDRAETTIPFSSLKRGVENAVSVGKDGKGTLFYDLLMSYDYAADTVPPAEQGMSIRRDILPMEGSDKPVQSATVGQTYRVTLTMTVPDERRNVAVEGMLPAGFEAVDAALATSRQTGLSDDVAESRNPYPWWSPWDESSLTYFIHRETRDDRVFLFAEVLPPGVYRYTFLARATLPGTFRMRPSRIWEMYYPENFGQSDGVRFTVKE